jgi:SAM-dependent methyltransferase
MNYAKIVHEVIEEHNASPVAMLGVVDATGQRAYLSNLEHSYERTVRDVGNLFENDKATRSVLEIGSFLGPVSFSLKRLGFSVCALDIPEYYESPSLRELYEKNGVPFTGVNLRRGKLPYESSSLDVVVMCEVLEHLNFNPLPVLMEINRVLKPGGYLYIGMPNQASIANRVRLLRGRSIHNPIEDFSRQLDREHNMIVGLHWREYTEAEAVQMIERMGFEAATKYYFVEKGRAGANVLRSLLRSLAYAYPPFRPYQVVLGRKVRIPTDDFWLTDANS